MLASTMLIGINHVNQHSIVTCINHVKIGIFLKRALDSLDPDLFYHDFEVAELQSCIFLEDHNYHHMDSSTVP